MNGCLLCLYAKRRFWTSRSAARRQHPSTSGDRSKPSTLSTLAFRFWLDRGDSFHLINFLVLKIAIHDHHLIGRIKNHEVYCYIHRLFKVHVDPKVNKSFLRRDVLDGNRGVANKPFKVIRALAEIKTMEVL